MICSIDELLNFARKWQQEKTLLRVSFAMRAENGQFFLASDTYGIVGNVQPGEQNIAFSLVGRGHVVICLPGWKIRYHEGITVEAPFGEGRAFSLKRGELTIAIFIASHPLR